MAFMMPVVKNDWDIYHSQRTRRTSESTPEGRSARARKISESRSEGPALSPRCLTPGAGMGSPHRSAPTIRSASYCRAPPSRASRASLRPSQPESPCKTASGNPAQNGRSAVDKFHSRTQSLRLPERPRVLRRLPSEPAPPPPPPAAAPQSRGDYSLRRRLSAEPEHQHRARYCGGCVPYLLEFRRRGAPVSY